MIYIYIYIYIYPPPQQLGSFFLGGIWTMLVCSRGSFPFFSVVKVATRFIFPRLYLWCSRLSLCLLQEFAERFLKPRLRRFIKCVGDTPIFLFAGATRFIFRRRYLWFGSDVATRFVFCRRYLWLLCAMQSHYGEIISSLLLIVEPTTLNTFLVMKCSALKMKVLCSPHWRWKSCAPPRLSKIWMVEYEGLTQSGLPSNALEKIQVM